MNSASRYSVLIDIPSQTLSVSEGKQNIVLESRVATAKNGAGEQSGSECTPRGQHIIRAKIGEGCPENMVFVGRRPTGETFSRQLRQLYPQRDWILTRILWLSGVEVGKNRLGKVDTMRRYIYIHGAPDEDEMGKANSHGCIKMSNKDIVTLFDLIPIGTAVNIVGADS